MIRRRLEDGRFGLITQDDHARLAGQLACWLGTSRFRVPEPEDAFRAAVALHDAGWPAHDRSPTLNPRGLPTDVFESPRECAWSVWPGAVVAAGRVGAYAELLVSIHVLHLSAFVSLSLSQPGAVEPDELRRGMFEVNRFQQHEIERQHRLRRALGLSTALPLNLGLISEDHIDPTDLLDTVALRRERTLAGHYRWLQALDLISLAACCTAVPQAETPDVLTHVEDNEWEPLSIQRFGADVAVRPWPFRVEQIRLFVPMRVVRGEPFASGHEFQRQFAEAGMETLEVTVCAF